MKPARIITLFALFGLAAVAGVLFLRDGNAPGNQRAASSPSVPKEAIFTVRGRIISLDENSGIVRIAHEEIPHYMPAMTMPFLSRDSNSLRKLKAGDDVVFKLAVTSDDSWITEIQKAPGHASTQPSPMDPTAKDQEGNRLMAGEKVPNFEFVDQMGRNRAFEEFNTKFVVLTFIYSRCPLPNFCPLLNRKFSELEDRLGKEFPGKFHLLSVTIDPTYDTPEVLKQYASLQKADNSTWTFATGSPEQVADIAGLFGLTYNAKTPGLIDHDMRTALIAPDGRLIHIWKSNFWTPYEIRNRMEERNRQQFAQEP